jgi:transposase
VCLEEGTQSTWLYEILGPHAKDLAVVNVTESRGPKSDECDAFGLAEKLRQGNLERRVFKELGPYRKLRELARVYAMVVRDVVRVQNRIKSFMRSRGVEVAGKTVYSSEGREAYVKKLPAGTGEAVMTLYALYDVEKEVRKRAEKELVQEARNHRMAGVLESYPGIGPIRAAQLLPVVVTPHRFRTARQFWSYAGLGIVMRSSADWVRDQAGNWQRGQLEKTRGLNIAHNHQLKAIFKGAATTVITQIHDDPLYQDYARLLAGGTKPNLAKLTLARKIAAIVLAMWKNEEVYDPDKHRTPATE